MSRFKSGDHLGRFVLGEKIGEGGMGHVYKALEVSVDRLVAIKFLDEGQKKNSESNERFRVEAKALARLNHPNVVAMYAYGEEDGIPYIAMEYVDGINANTLIKNYIFSLRETIELFRQVLGGLGEAHRQGILHRDIKPENLLLTNDFKVKLSDFGLAKVTTDSGRIDLTKPNQIYCTIPYAAPEILLGRGPSSQTDLFSLGLVFYELLTRQRAFPGDNELQIMEKIKNHKLKFPPSCRGLVPDSLRRIVRRMTEIDPKVRYTSADEVLRDLDALQLGEHEKHLPLFSQSGFYTYDKIDQYFKFLRGKGFIGIEANYILLHATAQKIDLTKTRPIDPNGQFTDPQNNVVPIPKNDDIKAAMTEFIQMVAALREADMRETRAFMTASGTSKVALKDRIPWLYISAGLLLVLGVSFVFKKQLGRMLPGSLSLSSTTVLNGEPAYRVGMRFHYKVRYFDRKDGTLIGERDAWEEVTGVIDDGKVRFLMDDGGTRVAYRNPFLYSEESNPVDKNKPRTRNHYIGSTDNLFPLEVNKRATYQRRTVVESSGQERLSIDDCVVDSTEVVKIAIGNFNTYKVICRLRSDPQKEAAFQYSTDLGANLVVRRFSFFKGIKVDEVWELQKITGGK